MIGLVLDTGDAHEGCTAFLEKRKPQLYRALDRAMKHACTDFVMPKLGLTMTEGTVARWVVAPAQSLRRRGDIIAVIETDKIAYDVRGAGARCTCAQVLVAAGTPYRSARRSGAGMSTTLSLAATRGCGGGRGTVSRCSCGR